MYDNISKQLFANAFVGNHGIVNDLLSSILEDIPYLTRPNQKKIRTAIYNADCACGINKYLTNLVEKAKEKTDDFSSFTNILPENSDESNTGTGNGFEL